MKNLSNNLSVITLHLIVGEVQLSSNTDRGINWDVIANIHYLNNPVMFQSGSTNNNGATNGEGTTGGTQTTGVSSAVPGIELGQRSAGVQINRTDGITGITFAGTHLYKDFASRALVNFILKNLEKYGKVSIMQNTYITLHNGYKGKIDASRKTPYVKEIGVGVTGTGGATQSVQTVTFDDASSGVVIEITPIYNAQTDLLTLDIDSKIQDVPEYVTVNAGSYNVSRPIVIARNINTQIVMKAGSITVLGGLISNSEIYSSAASLTGVSRTKNKTNSELVIIIKPLITRFVFI